MPAFAVCVRLPASAPASPPPLRAAATARVAGPRAGRAHRRGEAEQHRGEASDHRHEHQHAPIEAGVDVDRIVSGADQADDQGCGARRADDAERDGRGGQHTRFGQHLLHEACASRADRGAQSHFASARRAAREQQIGDVRTRDQQHADGDHRERDQGTLELAPHFGESGGRVAQRERQFRGQLLAIALSPLHGRNPWRSRPFVPARSW